MSSISVGWDRRVPEQQGIPPVPPNLPHHPSVDHHDHHDAFDQGDDYRGYNQDDLCWMLMIIINKKIIAFTPLILYVLQLSEDPRQSWREEERWYLCLQKPYVNTIQDGSLHGIIKHPKISFTCVTFINIMNLWAVVEGRNFYCIWYDSMPKTRKYNCSLTQK